MEKNSCQTIKEKVPASLVYTFMSITRKVKSLQNKNPRESKRRKHIKYKNATFKKKGIGIFYDMFGG